MSTQIVQEPTRTDMCCHQRTFHMGGKYFFHWHEKYELFHVLDKPCRVLVNGQLIHALPGDIVVINERSVHRLFLDHEDTHVRIIQFPVRILLPITPSIKPLKPHITRAELDAIPELRATLDQLFQIMDSEHRVELTEQNPFFQSLFAAVYFLLMRHFATEETASSRNERQEFYQVVEYINEHYTTDINIQIIASRLYIPRGRLARLFRKYSGTDLNEYINSLRIQRANQLLLQGCRITEAATESGSQSIRTFNNLYRIHMGMTPSQFLSSRRES